MTAKFCPGDRVIEKPRPGDHVFSKQTANFDQIARYAASRRSGRVVRLIEKRSSRGSTIRYVEVVWDGLQSPSVHAASRLEPQQEST